jgi:hypothetical protein
VKANELKQLNFQPHTALHLSYIFQTFGFFSLSSAKSRHLPMNMSGASAFTAPVIWILEWNSPAVYSTLKRRRSLSLPDTTSCKKTRTFAESYVPKPANEPILCKMYTPTGRLQDAMEVDEGQYCALVVSDRYLRGKLPIWTVRIRPDCKV